MGVGSSSSSHGPPRPRPLLPENGKLLREQRVRSVRWLRAQRALPLQRRGQGGRPPSQVRWWWRWEAGRQSMRADGLRQRLSPRPVPTVSGARYLTKYPLCIVVGLRAVHGGQVPVLPLARGARATGAERPWWGWLELRLLAGRPDPSRRRRDLLREWMGVDRQPHSHHADNLRGA
jgi:hypothetical protein